MEYTQWGTFQVFKRAWVEVVLILVVMEYTQWDHWVAQTLTDEVLILVVMEYTQWD